MTAHKKAELLKRIVEHPVISAVIAAGVVTVCGWIGLWCWGEHPEQWIVAAGKAVVRFLGETTEVWRWHYWLLASGNIVLAIIVLGWLFRRVDREVKPECEEYKVDEIFGIVWRWNWNEPVLRLTSYCPHCDRMLPIRENYVGGYEAKCICGRYERTDLPYDMTQQVVREIEVFVRKGVWRIRLEECKYLFSA